MSLTKQQILSDFALLPLSTLESLYKYKDFAAIPSDDLLTNVNMAQLVDKAHTLADTYFPSWTDRSATDFGEFLVELFALFSEKDFVYINAFANQSILMKMTSYSMAFLRAIELGYEPKTTKSAVAPFNLIFIPGSSFLYETGQLVVQTKDGVKFTNTSAINVPTTLINYSLNTTLSQGVYSTDTFSYNGRSVDLRKSKIDISTIEVTVKGSPWTRVQNFGASTNNSTHYMVLPEEDGKCSIYFGADGYGLTPDLGSDISVKYMTCLGASGNVVTDATVSVALQSTSRPIDSTSMLGDSTNGLDASTLPALKNETLNYFRHRNACLNAYTTKAFLLEQPEVSKAYVVIVGNEVRIFFRNASGGAPTGGEQTAIINRVTPLLSNGFIAVYTATVEDLVATIDVDFYYLTGYDAVEIESVGRQLIIDITDPVALGDYGKDFDLSEVSILLRSEVPGLQNVVFNTVAGNPAATIVVTDSHILQKLAPGDITINMIPVV